MSKVLDSKKNTVDILEFYCCNTTRYLNEPLELLSSIISARKALELMACSIKTFHCEGRCPDDLGLVLKKNSTVTFDDFSVDIDADRAKALIRNLKKLATDKEEGLSRYLHYQGVRCPSLGKVDQDTLDAFDRDRIQRSYLEFYSKHPLFQLHVCEYLRLTHQDQLVSELEHPILHMFLLGDNITSLHSKEPPQPDFNHSWIETHCEMLVHMDKLQHQPFCMDASYVIARMIAEKYCFDQLLPYEKPKDNYELEDYLTRLQLLISKSKESLPILQQMYTMENLVRLIQKCSNVAIHFRNDETEQVCSPLSQLESSLQQQTRTNLHTISVASSTLAKTIAGQPAPRIVDEFLSIYEKDYRTLRNTLEQMNREHALQNEIISTMETRLKKYQHGLFMRNCFIAVTLSLVLLLGVCFGVNHLLSQRIERGVFADYIWENGVPKGILPLTAKEKSASSAFYVVTEQGGRVVSIEHMNQAGNLVNDVVRTNRAAKITVQYHDDGSLDSVHFFDASGKGMYARRYHLSDLSGIEFNEADSIGTLVYLPADFVNLQLADWVSGNSDGSGVTQAFSNISNISISQRNAAGQATAVTFQHGDEIKSDANGVTGFICQYDDPSGRMTSIEYQYDDFMLLQPDAVISRSYYYQGYHLIRTESMLGDGSTSTTKYEYDSSGNCEFIRFDSGNLTNANDVSVIRFIYDAQNRLLSQEYLNSEGHSTPGDAGYSILSYSYDEAGRITETVYSINQDTLTAGPNGWARQTVEYSDDGTTITTRYYDQYNHPYEFNGNACMLIKQNGTLITEYTYFDAYGAPTTQKEGVHRIVQEKNAECTWERLTAYHVDGSLYASEQTGFSTIEKHFDHSGRETKISYFDQNGNLCSGGASAITEYEYDRKGNITLTTRYDETGELLTADWAFCKKTYDPYGRLTQTEYRDNYKQLVVPQNMSYAKLVIEYGSQNEYKLSTTYGAAGQPVNGLDGVFAKRWNYDPNDRLISLQFLNENLQPTISPNYGYAICKYVYDTLSGQKIRESYLDPQGNLVLSSHGYAELIWVYDTNGNLLENAYYDQNRHLILPPKYGYAKVEKKYYDDGKLASVWLYGIDGSLIVSEQHQYAGLEWQYDQSGRICKWLYYGIDGQLFIHSNRGYAACSNEYDDYGRAISWTFYGVDGNPMIPEGMTYSTLRRTFDNNGYINYEAYFTPDGSPVCRNEAETYSAIYWERDLSGQTTKIMYLDSNNHPIPLTDGYAGIIYTYTENHLTKSEIYLDANGKPVELPDGYAAIAYDYDADNNKIYQGYFNKDGHPAAYDGEYSSIRWKWENGRNVERAYYDESGALTAYSSYDDYAMLRWKYNAQGLITQRFLYGEDGELLDGRGDNQAITRYTYDDQGRISTKMYYQADGITPPDYEAAGYGYEYNEQGLVSLLRYLGSDGEPILWPLIFSIEDGDWYTYDVGDLWIPYSYDEYLGAAQLKWEYDAHSRPISLCLLNSSGGLMRLCDSSDPMLLASFFPARFEWTYDKHGHTVSERISDADGLSSVYHETDCYGRSLLITAMDKDGHPKRLNEDAHFYGLRFSYNDETNVILISLLDESGQVFLDSSLGFAQLRLTYDKALYGWDEVEKAYTPFPSGDCLMVECLDTQGKHVISCGTLEWTAPYIGAGAYSYGSDRYSPGFAYAGSAITRCTYDKTGEHISHFDSNDRLFVNAVQGFAIADYFAIKYVKSIDALETGEYDVSLLKSDPAVVFYDATGKIMVNPVEGYAIMHKSKMSNGSHTLAYCDENDRPMLNTITGYAFSNVEARVLSHYSEHVRDTIRSESLFGLNGEPIDHAIHGYSIFHQEGSTAKLTFTFRNAAGELTVHPLEGYAVMQKTSNTVGDFSFSSTSYFDASNQLAINPVQGYAQMDITRNQGGSSSTIFRDSAGQIMNHPQWGYAEEREVYGEDDASTTYYDADGNIVINANPEVGYAQVVGRENPYHDTYIYRYLDPNGLDILTGKEPVF